MMQNTITHEIIDQHLMYLSVDENCNILNASNSFLTTFGYKESSISSKNLSTLIMSKDMLRLKESCAYVQEHKDVAKDIEIPIEAIDKKMIYSKIVIYPQIKNDIVVSYLLIFNNITSQYLLEKLQKRNIFANKKVRETKEFLSTTGNAVLSSNSKKVSATVKALGILIILLAIYASFTKIDSVATGEGSFIPIAKVQSIKNFEGGIVSELLVKEGDKVTKGDTLLKLSTISHQARLSENIIKLQALNAKKVRLEAQYKGLKVDDIVCVGECNQKLVDLEKKSFESNIRELNFKIAQKESQLTVKQSYINDSTYKLKKLEEDYKSLLEEYKIKESLQDKQIYTKSHINQLKKGLNDLATTIQNEKGIIFQTQTQVQEIKISINETKTAFINKSSAKYNEILSEIKRLVENRKNLEDIIKRATIVAPVNGTVKELFIHTIGASIQPTAEIMTLVPNDFNLRAEIEMKPKEIAKLYVGQNVNLKVTAFDYAVYGGLHGEISNISPDTIINKTTGDSNYLVYVKINNNYLMNNTKYKIKVGMRVKASILTGKKSILSYILKPILKTTQRQ